MAALLNSLSFAFTNSCLPISTVSNIMIILYYKVVQWDIGRNVIGVYRWILTKCKL